MSKFGAFADKTTRDLFGEAYSEAVGSVSKGLDPEAIEALYVGNFSADLFEGTGTPGSFDGGLGRPGPETRDPGGGGMCKQRAGLS